MCVLYVCMQLLCVSAVCIYVSAVYIYVQLPVSMRRQTSAYARHIYCGLFMCVQLLYMCPQLVRSILIYVALSLY